MAFLGNIDKMKIIVDNQHRSPLKRFFHEVEVESPGIEFLEPRSGELRWYKPGNPVEQKRVLAEKGAWRTGCTPFRRSRRRWD